jgi:hypothetical protein
VRKAWVAMFGEMTSSEINSLYVEGYFHGRDVPNKTTIKRPNLFRTDYHNGTMIYDGKRAVQIETASGEEDEYAGWELIPSEYWGHFEVDIALYFPAFFDYPFEFRGITRTGGRDNYELYVKLPLGGSVSYFIDAESFLISRRLVSWDGDPDKALWENVIHGYTEYNGIMYPDGYAFEGHEGPEQGFFKNVDFNVLSTDELFEIPDNFK